MRTIRRLASASAPPALTCKARFRCRQGLIGAIGLLALVSCGAGALAQQPLGLPIPSATVPPRIVPPQVIGPRVPEPPATIFLADQRGFLGTIAISTGALRRIGELSAGPGKPRLLMTDIAFCPGGALYGITDTQFHRINPATARTTLIGSHGVRGLNALVCNARGELLAHSFLGTRLHFLDKATGRSIRSVATGSFKSAGDLAYHKFKRDIEVGLFLTSLDEKLVKLNKVTGVPISRKLHGIANMFGLVSTGIGRLYGFADTVAYKLDQNGPSTMLWDFTRSGVLQGINGAAYNGNFQS
jgi:hypothetical protein